MVVIGIDRRSRGAEDVRLPLTTLDESQLKARGGIMDIQQKVQQIPERRPGDEGFGTDILGALKQGAHYASEKPGHKPVVIGLTNLEAQAPAKTAQGAASLVRTDREGALADAAKAREQFTYPEGTEGAFFYVTPDRYDVLQDYWTEILSAVGVNISPMPAAR